MSDDFDKQDDDFDWLGDDDDSSSSSESGLTGELSWLQDSDDSPDANKGRSDTDDLSLDWLSDGDDDSTPKSEDSTGVTGELSWLSDDTVSRVPDAQSANDLDWMASDDELEPDEEPIPTAPDWISGESDDSAKPSSESPDWLSDVGDTGMLNRDAINQELDSLDDDVLDSAPSWLSDVGDTGMLNRDAINQELDNLDDETDEQPDWLSNMGMGSDDSDSDEAEDELDLESMFGFDDDDDVVTQSDLSSDEQPDWLSNMGMGSDDSDSDDAESGLDLESMFGFDEDADEEVISSSDTSTSSDDHDTGWLEYEGDDEEEYDPYAQYEGSSDDGEDEYDDDLFSTGTSVDTDFLESNKGLFDSDQPMSDVSAEDTPDWLAGFDSQDFAEDEIPEVEKSGDPDVDTGWLDGFDSEDFTEDEIPEVEKSGDSDVDTGWLDGFDSEDFTEDEIPEAEESGDPDVDTDWLDEFDEDLFTNDPLDDVPDWLKTDDNAVGDTDDLTPIADPDEFASAPEMTADELLESMGLDAGERPSTGLTGELDAVDDELDRASTGLTGELSNLDDSDFDFLDEMSLDDLDLGDDSEFERAGTGLTGELDRLDDDMDLSFLDEVEVGDELERTGTGLTGELGSLDDDMDLSFLDEVEVGDELERAGTGLTGELSELDDELDMSFLDEIDDDSATGLTGELEDAGEELDFSFLDDADDEPAEDWFGEASDAIEAEPNWMQTLSEADITELEEEANASELDDIFDSIDLDKMDFDDLDDIDEFDASADLDTLLAGYEDFDESDFSGDDESGIEDLDAIFDAALGDEADEEDELRTDIPEWLRGVDVSSDEKSAAAIIRQQDDKPIEDLDDRLQALREKGLSLSSQAVDTKAESGVLEGVGETLVAPTIRHEASGIVSDLALTDSQKKQSELLQKIVGVTITPTVEIDEDGTPIVESTRSRRRSLPAIGLGRLLISVVLFLVLILPFVSNFGVGSLPPMAFGSDNQSAGVVFNQIEALNDGDLVLVGFEYGPTGAGELDPMADILLRHIVSQGAKPIIVSSNPIAIVHAQNIINEINRSVESSGLSLVENRDYYITRYLTGGTLGLRDLSQNLNSVINVSSQGEPTNLAITSLNEFGLIVLIAERSEDIRSWVEQIVPSTTTDVVAATGYSAQPLAEPYVAQTDGIQGLMIGYRDAYTYGEMLQGLYATATPLPSPTFTDIPTETSTPVPTTTPLPTNTDVPEVDADSTDIVPQGVISGTDGDEEEDILQPTATDTPVPTETNTPEPTATATNTPVPTDTPTNTPSPSPTPRLITVIVVIAPNASVNVRTGPSSNFPVLTTASTGDVYQVIGENDEGDWINFLLPDGREGWIAAFLVEKTELPEDDFEAESEDSADAGNDVTVMRVSYNRRLGKNQARYYQQVPTETPIVEVTPEVTDTDPRASYAFDRDRSQEASRLNAMTMGTIVAVLIILFGNIYFGLRAIIRRRRESKR